MTTPLVIWTGAVSSEQALAWAGPKMGRLAELRAAGLQVPQSFSITNEAFRRWSMDSGFDAEAHRLLADLDPRDHDRVAEVSAQVRDAALTRPLPADLVAAVSEAYDQLCDLCTDVNVPTAVRSSATGEDGASSSFAGAFDTYLGVSGIERVLDAVHRCWASLFTARAVAYRAERGVDHTAMPMAVGVVELVHARSSGVGFSVHPVTGRDDRLVIEASWGWGEAVVQGAVTPDHVEVGKADKRILRYDVSSKDVVSTFDFAIGRVVEIDMPERLRQRRCLTDGEVTLIAEALQRIEQHYGHPVDVEWVIDKHHRPGEPISVVQVRPVTVATAAAPAAYDPAALAAKHIFGR